MYEYRSGGWSPGTEDVLRRAGWQPGRAVPTETWEAVVRERGPYETHDAARRFLAEFGGLTTYGWPADSINTSSAICFDPMRAAWQDERFARAGREAGAALYPVGTADEGTGLLGIGEDGALYLIRDGAERLGGLDRLVQAQGTRSALWSPAEPTGENAFWRQLRALEGESDTDRVLRAGGWFPDRSVPTGTWEAVLLQTGEFEMHDAARHFLAEFGALGVPHPDSKGSTPWMEFSLDPLLALWDAEIIDDLAEQAGGVDLYPLGMRDRGNQYLAMASDGSVFAGMDSVWLLAPAPDEALTLLTTPLRPTGPCV
ncbi:SUKH-3 domain-containing protein [Streptomyces sp. BBFR51]|uniref:SUKH-3 domain-containing protein n=1 Tax=Streptomyces sp. BBFR51 TaxID=3372856 RepID=UPI0037DCE815